MAAVVHLVVLAIRIAAKVLEHDGGLEVAVIRLGLFDHGDDLIQLPEDLRVLVDGIDVGGGFHPLVEVAVVPVGALVFAFLEAGDDLEVVVGVAGVTLEE